MQPTKITLDNLALRSKRDKPNRSLDPEKLVTTTDELCGWIKKEFPNAHLTEVSEEVSKIGKEAVKKAHSIRTANLWLRLGIFLILATLAGALGHQLWVHPWKETAKFLDETKGVGMYAVAMLVFLITLEVRWKRSKCLIAIHELRSVAHIIDMHQLAKDPMIEQFRKRQEDGDMAFEDKMEAYLHACIALLALVSKLGQLYIDHFPDPTATTCVTEFEETCNGLAMKVYSKIINLQQNRMTSVVRPLTVPTDYLRRDRKERSQPNFSKPK